MNFIRFTFVAGAEKQDGVRLNAQPVLEAALGADSFFKRMLDFERARHNDSALCEVEVEACITLCRR